MAEKHSWKGELLQYLDIGLSGTFIGLKESETEKGYVFVKYKPFSNGLFHFPKPVVYPKPIHEDHIHFVIPKKPDIEGVEKRIVMIATGESGSLVRDIIDREILAQNEQLKEENRLLRMNIASSRQGEEDARSGVNKQISSTRALDKSARREMDYFGSPFMGNPMRNREPQDDDQFDSF